MIDGRNWQTSRPTPLHISGVTTNVDPHPSGRSAIVSVADGQAQGTRHCSTPWAASKFQRAGDVLMISDASVLGPTEAHGITSSSSKLKMVLDAGVCLWEDAQVFRR